MNELSGERGEGFPEECPKCGNRYSWIERRVRGDQIYYYAVHEKREEGKRKVKKCYLGPKWYKNVSKLHFKEDLVFSGLVNPQRIQDYVNQLHENVMNADSLNYFGLIDGNGCPKVNEAKELIKKFREIADKVEHDLNIHLQVKEVKPTEEWSKAVKEVGKS